MEFLLQSLLVDTTATLSDIIDEVKGTGSIKDLNELYLFISSILIFWVTGYLAPIIALIPGLKNLSNKTYVNIVHSVVFVFIAVFGFITFGMNISTLTAIISIFVSNKFYDFVKDLFGLKTKFKNVS